MSDTTRILIVEDLAADFELARREIEKSIGPAQFLRVDTRDEYLGALDEFRPTLIVSDFSTPGFDGMTALRLALERVPEVPFVLLAGLLGEDTAVDCMKAGAWDCVIKEHMSRLGPAVFAALEQKKLRDENRKNEDARLRLQQIFDHAAWGMDITDVDRSVILSVNPACAKMHGYAVDEMVGMDLLQIFAPEDRGDVPIYARIAQERGHHSYESTHLRKDGTSFPCWTDVTTFTGDDGRPQFRAANLVDLTERKQMEAMLRESQERARILFDRAADVILQLEIHRGQRAVIREINDAALKLLGYTREELIGQPTSTIEADPVASEVIARWRRERPLEPYLTLDIRHRCKDGSVRDFECSLTEISIGSTRYCISVERDVTERRRSEEALRQSEERYRNLFEFLNDAALIADETGNIVDANHRAESLFGRPRHEIIGMHHADLHPRGQAEKSRENFPSYAETGRVIDFDWEVARPDGKTVPVSISTTRLTLGDRPVLLGLFRDLTEHRKLEDQIRQTQKMESIGRLAGGVAHDFNNMLSVILGNAEAAMEKTGPVSPTHFELEEIRKAALRSADLTQQLLAFARRQTIVPKVLDLNEVLADMSKMLRRLIGENIDLVSIPGDGLWPIKIDPGQVHQILANLCVNARDAISDVGSVTVETANATVDDADCAAHVGSVPGDYVRLTVGDSGCGMNPDVIEHIFEPFFTTKPPSQGTGLGLSTVYGIVKQNGGFLDVVSEVGKGTTFAIYLPRVADRAVAPHLEAPVDIGEGHGETILIVEDEPTILDLASRMLGKSGYAVLTARTAAQAMDVVQASASIDLLLVDMVMPEMSGADLAARIAELRPQLRCLFMSGYLPGTGHAIVLEQNMPFLQKPFSSHTLKVAVRRALDSQTNVQPRPSDDR
jgi:two-component system, cell cycle sensor histidine kinase and response regulator CckA